MTESQLNPQQVVQEALDAANGGNMKLAIIKLKTWLTNNNEDIDNDKICRYYLGVMYDKTGSVEESIQIWKEGITNKPPYNSTTFKSVVDALSVCSNDITICTLIAEFSVPNSTDYDFHIAIAQRRDRQAKDGPSVSYSYGQVCYGPSKLSEDESKQWIEMRTDDAIKHYQAAISLQSDNPNLYAQFAGFLEWNKQYNKAGNIWRILSEEYCTTVKCWVGMARCLYHLKQYEKCRHILENVAVKIDPKEAEIYTILQSVADKLNLSSEYVQELTNKNKFYSIIPEWLNMTFTNEIWLKFTKLYNIKSTDNDDQNTIDETEKKNENYVDTLINTDSSLMSTKLLISYVNGHYNHGTESIIFNCLIDRMKNHNQDLISYIRAMLNAGSVCVIKGAANTLAELKDDESVHILCKLLPRDTRAFWSMDIADALGKLQNYEAIHALAKIVSYGFNSDADADGDGGMMMMVDHTGNQQRCARALGVFADMKRNQVAVNTLKLGCQLATKQELKICCLVSLFRIYAANMNNDQNKYKKEFDGFFEQILGYLNSMQGNGVPYVIAYVINRPLKEIKQSAMNNNIEYVVQKCGQLFRVIEQEQKEEQIREQQKKLKQEQEDKQKELEMDDTPSENDQATEPKTD